MGDTKPGRGPKKSNKSKKSDLDFSKELSPSSSSEKSK